MNDDDVKDTLPVHVILGSGEYAKIKTQTRPRIGDEKAPIAELTKFGWFLMVRVRKQRDADDPDLPRRVRGIV